MNVSTNHRLLTADEIPAVTTELADSWKDPSIPRRQWESVVRGELEQYRKGVAMPHFDVAVRMLKSLPLKNPSLLDVGASSGYYREVLEIGGFDCYYSALDFSEPYKELAVELYPDIEPDFYVADAQALPFADNRFDIILHSATIMHTPNYLSAIRSAAKVAARYVVFHRTPVVFSGPTVAYQKEAYGVPCIEWHFQEGVLRGWFEGCGLTVIREETIFRDTQLQYSHKTYLTKKS